MGSVKNHLTKSLKDRVEDYLRFKPQTRGSDRLLIASIWEQESWGATKNELLESLVDGTLSNPESIRRQRQLLQKEYPELRGTNQAHRKADEQEIREMVRA